MPRKRQIDPGIWTSDQFTDLDIPARLLFIGMFSNADDDGRLKASPKYLKATIFPGDSVLLLEITGWRAAIVKVGLAQLYENSGVEYLWLPNFTRHQYISHKVESKLPIPETTGGLQEKSRRRVGGKQDKGRRPPVVLTPIGTGTVVGYANEVGTVVVNGASADPPQPDPPGALLDLQGWKDRLASEPTQHVGILGEMCMTLGYSVRLSRLASIWGRVYNRDSNDMAATILKSAQQHPAGDFLSYVEKAKGPGSQIQGAPPRSFEGDAAQYERWVQGKERGVPPSPPIETGGDCDTAE